MDLNKQLESSFVAVCDAYRESGFTDINLSCDGNSNLRGSDGMVPITSPSSIAIAHLGEVIAGRERVDKLMEEGGEFTSTWNGMRIAIAKLAKDRPFHIVVRLK